MGAPAPAPRSGLNPPIPLTPRAAAPPAAAVVWPVHRPTHAPATTLKTNSNSASHKNKKRINPRLPRRRAGSRRSSGVTAPNGRSCARPAQRIKSPNPPNPSCCRSTGGCGCLAGPPANTCSRNKPSKQTATTPPHKNKKRIILVASLQRRDGAEWALLRPPRAADSTPHPLTPRAAAPPAAAVGWPVHRPTHAPATSPQNKQQQRLPQKQKAHNTRRVTPAA